jgi:RNA polymerase sigma-70 factor (ECF subfamily)
LHLTMNSSDTCTNDYTDLVRRIHSGDVNASEDLYHRFHRGLEFFIRRQNIPDIDDKIQEVFLATLVAIKAGELRDPTRLAGFIIGIARNLIYSTIRQLAVSRVREVGGDANGLDSYVLYNIPALSLSPYALLENKQRIDEIKQALATLCERDREIITRFYLQEENAEHICADMNLTATQFRIFKSRAKAILTRGVQRRSASQELGRMTRLRPALAS